MQILKEIKQLEQAGSALIAEAEKKKEIGIRQAEAEAAEILKNAALQAEKERAEITEKGRLKGEAKAREIEAGALERTGALGKKISAKKPALKARVLRGLLDV
ncbi:MAG: hypothetical protein V1493_03670 [Candidatus Diapherotrites archaeon]